MSDISLTNRDALKAREYWKESILKVNTKNEFPHDIVTKTEGLSRETQVMVLPKELSGKINKLSNGSNLLVYIIMMSGVQKLFYEYQGSSLTCIASPITEKENTVQDILPIVLDFKEIKNFKDLLLEVRSMISQSYKYQTYAIETMFGEEDKINVNNLTDVVLAHSNIHTVKKIDFDGIVINIIQDGDLIKLEWEYSELLYKKESISNFERDLVAILEQGINQLEYPLKEFEMVVDEDEREKLLVEWQGKKYDHPQDKHIYEFFKEQAMQRPDKTAVISLNRTLTYAESYEYVRKLAAVLKENQVGQGDRVAIYTKRHAETIVEILAVLSLGAAYVPLEEDYPEERVKYIIQDSKVKVLLVEEDVDLKIEVDCPVIRVNLDKLEDSNIELSPKADSPVYVIYTSGTTGKPKGVEINNVQLVNLCYWFQREHEISEESNIFLLNAFGFDASVKNIFTPFICGATLILGPEHLFDTGKIINMITDYNATHLNCVPSLFYALIDVDKSYDFKHLSSLKFVVLGGEAIIAEPLRCWLQQESCHTRISNVYGPTECTSISVAKVLEKEELLNDNNVSIGKPIDNKLIYILNEEGKICPIGIPGELYISGMGTATHYINNEEYSRRCFVENIFDKSQVMYKTGDLVRWRDNGELDFIGRKDFQVKVQGHRIELGEIESRLNQCEGIKRSVVLKETGSNGNDYLVAYVEKEKGENIEEEQIKDFLKKWLPTYMIPRSINVATTLPVTVNGKVDRSELAKMEKTEKAPTEGGVVNLSTMQRQLMDIWKELLNINYIGIHENFFDAGGYSLLLYKLIKILEERFNITVSYIELMTYPTIASLAQEIENRSKESEKEENEVKDVAALKMERIRKLKQRKANRGE